MRMPKRTTKATSVLMFGDITVDQKTKNTWHKVDITGKFNKPVVIMGAPSMNGKDPITIRVKEVTRKSFKWQMQEWSYLDQTHAAETISYMIVEAGSWKLPDGTWFEAGRTAGTSKWRTVKFAHKFKKAPVVFSQITTQQKAKPYTTRQHYVTNKQFRVYIQAEEKQRVTENEEISWVAFDLTSRKATK
jgi:hypothetical protein